MPRASIIMPAFNAQEFIERAIESAITQTEPDVEIIVIDDDSTDATVAVVERCMKRDSRIRLLRSDTNGGPSRARNMGLDAATGRWIALLDADDAYKPTRLKTLIDHAERAGADMVADNLSFYDSGLDIELGTALAGWDGRNSRQVDIVEFVEQDIPGEPGFKYGFLKPIFCSAFLRLHDIRYREDMRFGEDFIFCFNCLSHGALFSVVHEALYIYSVRESSLSHHYERYHRDLVERVNAELLSGLHGRESTVNGQHATLAVALERRGRTIQHFNRYRLFVEGIRGGQLAEAAHALRWVSSWPYFVEKMGIALLARFSSQRRLRTGSRV